MLSTLPLFLLKTWYLYTAHAIYIAPAILIGLLAFEPEEPTDADQWTFAEVSFYAVFIATFAIYFHRLYPQHDRKKQALYLITSLLVLQSLVAFFAWQYPDTSHCDLRSKLTNWAFSTGRFECPRSTRHYISLKYLIEFVAELVWTPFEVLFRLLVRLYREHFGGGWLDPGAWMRWIMLIGSMYLFATGGYGRSLV